MQRAVISEKFATLPDLLILLLVGTAIYGLVAMGSEWSAAFNPVTAIDLAPSSLPYYAILSGARGLIAYLFSLSFTLVVGYTAAKSERAEKIIIPLLDILQSIPVLGFLPGLVFGLIALFPKTNLGLELAAIIMIFTSQVWNMTFSYYSSLKSIPPEFMEASTVMGLNWKQRLIKLELPFSAVNLAWNSLMSMAGGWFFLGVCEAFRLGDTEFRLPGLGAYMAVAAETGNHRALVLGIITMVLLIVTMDAVIWRPILAWVQRFRIEDVPGVAPAEPLMKIVIRESRIMRWLKLGFRRYRFRQRMELPLTPQQVFDGDLEHPLLKAPSARQQSAIRILGPLLYGLTTAMIFWGSYKLLLVLMLTHTQTWMLLIRDTLWTFLRVLFALAISTVWAVPVGIWIGTSPRRIRFAQPIIQVMASFPVTMLYVPTLGLFFWLGIGFDISSMLLMTFGIQWYILFNVLAGALRIPNELKYALELMEVSVKDKWLKLYLPSIFPSLVTGWVTAAGGAWNTSIVAEYVGNYHHTVLKTSGIGARISQAAETRDFQLLAASISILVFVVVIFNRAVWSKVYHLAQTRFRMDA
ncbi:MAG: ABC transporter permease subunit [Bdellovibrionota bacterium]